MDIKSPYTLQKIELTNFINLRYLSSIFLFALFYFLVSRLGLFLPFSGEVPEILCTATAVSIVVLLISGLHLWPGIIIGAVAVTVIEGHSLPFLIGTVTAHAAEIVVAAWLLRRHKTFDFCFKKFDDIRIFFFSTAIVGPFVGATIGTLTFLISPELASGNLINLFWEWWAGHAMSSFIIIPAILTTYSNRTFSWSRHQTLELVLVFSSLILVCILIFIPLPDSAINLPLGHVVFPFLLWLALRFSPRELTIASLFVSIMAAGGTMAGVGPFLRTQSELNLLLLLTFVISIAFTTLVIATITAQQREGELNLEKRNNELEERVASRTASLQIANTHLEQTRDQALDALALKNQILANVSHDARTPLNIISLYADLLMSGAYGPVNDKQHERLDTLLSSSKELLRFINNLLDEAQLSTKELSPTLERINIAAWLHQRKSLVSPLTENKNLALSVSVDESMPQSLVVDTDWLNQIFNNLVDNAIKFTDNGRIDISISSNPECGTWRLEVADTGIGLPEIHQERVFEAFWQVDGSNTRKVNRGIGLGLSIVKRRVQCLGGSINIQDRLDGGTIFTVDFPLQTEVEK